MSSTLTPAKCGQAVAVRLAPPQLYDLYVCLYTKNYTQNSLAVEWNYTPQYIQKLNKKLLLFLQTQLKE